MSALREKQKEIAEKVKIFLENLKPEDKIGLIFHDDTDGFVSARLFYEFLQKKGCKNISISVLTIGKGIENNDFHSADKLIILDLGPNLIMNVFTSFSHKPILYIDHHQKDEQIPEGIVGYRVIDAISTSRVVYEILEGFVSDLEWLAIAGVLADMGDKHQENFQFIRAFFEKNKLRIMDFKKNINYPISNMLIYFEDNLTKAFGIFKEIKFMKDIDKIKKYSEPIDREIERFVNLYKEEKEEIGDVKFFYFEPKFKIKSTIINIISTEAENEDLVIIFANPEENIIRLSARCQSGRVDVAELMKKFTEGFENANGGGHKMAAGGFIMKKDFEEFKEKLRRARV